MNNTITLSQIIARLAKITDSNPLTARTFLRTFFSEIEKGLKNGEEVRIKGIGTFRRTDDPLAPHPVIFIPGRTISEEINQPFSMFEPVELSDDISEEELGAWKDDSADGKTMEEIAKPEPRDEPAHEEEPAVVEGQTEILHEEPIFDHAEEEAAGEVAANEEKPVSENEEIGIVSEETASGPAEDNPISDTPAEETADEATPVEAVETISSEKTEDIPAEKEEVPEEEPEDASDAQAEEEEPEVEPVLAQAPVQDRGLSPLVWIFLGFAIGIAIGYFIGFNIGSRHAAASSDAELLTTIVFPDTIASEAITAPVAADAPAPKADTVAVSPAPAVEPAPEAEAAPKPETPRQEEKRYDTVTRRRYLATMAREYYGAMEYWVFIYKANEGKLGNPDKIAPGTKVEIPPFSRYATGKTPEENLEKARRMSKEIYSRYRK